MKALVFQDLIDPAKDSVYRVRSSLMTSKKRQPKETSVKFFVCAAVTFISLSAMSAFAAKTETKEFDAKYVKSLDVENMDGAINITGVAADKAIVVAEQEKFPADCRLEISQEGTEVKVKVDQKNFLRKDCIVNFTINLPVNVKLNVKQGNGNLTILNTKGAIDYKLGTGDVSIDAEVVKVDGKIGSGTTTVKGLLGDAHFFAGSGTHKITYAKVPAKGEIDIKTGTGNADITLPADTKFQLDSRMGSGKVTNDIGENKSAKFKVIFRAGSGNLNILKN